jgi:hypothetical protein
MVLKKWKWAYALINKDETRNITRPEKGRRKLVGCSRATKVEGHHQDCTDATDLPLISTISYSGNVFTPLLITISDVHYNDADLDLQGSRFLAYKTPKEYMTNILMTFSLKAVIKTYSQAVRAEIRDPEAFVF